MTCCIWHDKPTCYIRVQYISHICIIYVNTYICFKNLLGTFATKHQVVSFHSMLVFFIFFDLFFFLHSYRSGFLQSLPGDSSSKNAIFPSRACIATRQPWRSFRLNPPPSKRTERVWRGGLIRSNFSSSGDPSFFSVKSLQTWIILPWTKRPGHS